MPEVEISSSRKRPRLSWDVAPSEPADLRGYPSPPWREDDREGHYVFELGENLTPRYKIISKMGEGMVFKCPSSCVYAIPFILLAWLLHLEVASIVGTFGRVLECWDRVKLELVAVKVVRSIPKYRHAAMIEIDVLNQLADNDQGNSHCLQIRRWFDYRNHICIVCEKLGLSLFDSLRRNKYSPFPVDLVREFGRQLLESVSYMHDLHLIHTDLKPENILLVSSASVKAPIHKRSSKRNSQDDMQFRCLPKSSAIKLIDFGSTAFESQDRSSIVSTRHYRAPEIILGLGWNYPCDLWSVGCILVELCMGEALFRTHENLEHLAMMERVLGPLPEQMIRKVNSSAMKYFKRGERLNWPEGATSRESIGAVRKLDGLKELIYRNVNNSRASLIKLLQGLLKYDPSERFTAHEALKHPFFNGAV